jgi:hypothetical protein
MKFILFFFISLSVYGQGEIVLLKSTRTGKYKKFSSGKIIQLESLGGAKINGSFAFTNDTAIFLQNGYGMHKDSIKSIILYRRFLHQLSYKLFAAAFLYPIAAGGNKFLSEDRPIFTEYDLFVSGSLLSFGGLIKVFSRRKYKLYKKRWRMEYILIK